MTILKEIKTHSRKHNIIKTYIKYKKYNYNKINNTLQSTAARTQLKNAHTIKQNKTKKNTIEKTAGAIRYTCKINRIFHFKKGTVILE